MVARGIGICGVGAVTGYGWGTAAFWDGLVAAKPAATLTPGYGPDRDGFAWVARVPDGGDPAEGRSRFARAMRFAAREAVTDARARGWQPGGRVGCCTPWCSARWTCGASSTAASAVRGCCASTWR